MADANERMTAAEFRRRYVDGGERLFDVRAGGLRPIPEHRPLDMPPPKFGMESHFQDWLRVQAIHRGWKFYHTYSSKRSDPGFPDAPMIYAPVECMAELKMPGEKPTDLQHEWLDDLAHVRHVAEASLMYVCLWCPEMEEDILRFLDHPMTVKPPGEWCWPHRDCAHS